METSFLNAVTFIVNHPTILFAVIVWSLAWKGSALWRAARSNQLYWFIALLLINTFGILEICYLYFIAPKTHHQA